jgi:hypothetical protein
MSTVADCEQLDPGGQLGRVFAPGGPVIDLGFIRVGAGRGSR